MQSSALNSSGMSMYLHRSPSGAQRRIRQRMGVEWQALICCSVFNHTIYRPLQKSNLNNSLAENLSSTNSPVISNNSYNTRPSVDSLGYRSLIESSDYRSLLSDEPSSKENPAEEKLNSRSLSTSLNNSFGSSPIKPTPLPRSQEQSASPPQSLLLSDRQRHNSDCSNFTLNSKPLSDNSLGLSSSSLAARFNFSTDLNGSQLPQNPLKPTVHVQPFPVIRSQQPPPVPEKPKSLQTAKLKTVEISADKSTSSLGDFDYSNPDNEALNQFEVRRIATLTNLYEKVSGRWEDLKNLHNEKKKNAELFQQTMEIAQRNGIPTSPFLHFIKRFEAVYEVQTRLVLNKQQLRKSLETTHDEEFLLPLIEQNNSNTQDIERIVDELDATFRQLDAQLCNVLDPDQHERWVFFVRTLYSLIAEQTSIQFKVGSVVR